MKISSSDPKKWDELWRTGRLPIVQLTILVPIFGYLILFSDWVQTKFTVFDQFPIWKMYFLYYGFTSLAIGTLIYNWKCPKLVKLYGSAEDYIFKEKDIFHDTKLLDLLKKNYILIHINKIDRHEELPSHVIRFFNDLGEFKDDIVLTEALRRETGGLVARNWTDHMFAHFKLLEVVEKPFRYLVYGLYRVGFFLIFIPSFWTFFEIICRTFKTFAK